MIFFFITTEEVIPQAELRTREPPPHHTEIPSSSGRRRRSRRMEPPRASVDCTASPLPQRLLTPDEFPFGSRMSVDAKPESFSDFGIEQWGTNMGDVPHMGALFENPIFPMDPSPHFWPGETSRTWESPSIDAPNESIIAPMTVDFPPADASDPIDISTGHFGISDSGTINTLILVFLINESIWPYIYIYIFFTCRFSGHPL